MKTDEQILEAVRRVLNNIADIGKVDIRFGGDATWVNDRRARRNYWIVTLPRQRHATSASASRR